MIYAKLLDVSVDMYHDLHVVEVTLL